MALGFHSFHQMCNSRWLLCLHLPSMREVSTTKLWCFDAKSCQSRKWAESGSRWEWTERNDWWEEIEMTVNWERWLMGGKLISRKFENGAQSEDNVRSRWKRDETLWKEKQQSFWWEMKDSREKAKKGFYLIQVVLKKNPSNHIDPIIMSGLGKYSQFFWCFEINPIISLAYSWKTTIPVRYIYIYELKWQFIVVSLVAPVLLFLFGRHQSKRTPCILSSPVYH